ncbi:hypothetical protein PYCCODRAFT_904091 [Trametes coccinea BRFM310]|uniref:Uncharacterized protein n=1 Tax=Trametes coccinea (strain BRFM310) TaxID=1353009 RepID=A0A1Y2ICI1_TRAC3|nr:hypothetical protein PYCCODRAFT_904091 [Trametes coccinea BRFM310]
MPPPFPVTPLALVLTRPLQVAVPLKLSFLCLSLLARTLARLLPLWSTLYPLQASLHPLKFFQVHPTDPRQKAAAPPTRTALALAARPWSAVQHRVLPQRFSRHGPRNLSDPAGLASFMSGVDHWSAPGWVEGR